MKISGYRCMWVTVMFDLPVGTKAARKEYHHFRQALIRDGFAMMQFSVYVRNCASLENAEVHVGRVKNWVPPDGQVRIINITDKQFERMHVFWGKRRVPPEEPPKQLEFF